MLTGTKPITMEMRQDYTVTQWSLEMRINMSELGDGVTPGVGYPGPPSYQNQAIFLQVQVMVSQKMVKFISVSVMARFLVIFCR